MALAPQRLWTNHACIPDTIIVPHPDIERFVYAKVGFLARQLHRISAAILTEEGTAADRLTGIQCGVLEVVNAMGSVDQTGVCEILGVDRSTLAGVVDRLQERALIERTVDPVDRRSNALAITSAGRRAIERERVMNARADCRAAGARGSRAISRAAHADRPSPFALYRHQRRRGVLDGPGMIRILIKRSSP